MAIPRKDLPEFWVKGIAALVAGDDVCEFKAWFRARHSRWTKPKGDFDFKAWEVDHTAMLQKKFAELGSKLYEKAVREGKEQGILQDAEVQNLIESLKRLHMELAHIQALEDQEMEKQRSAS